MMRVLTLIYSLMPQGFEHEALSTALLNFEQFLQPLMPQGVSQFLVLSASILAIFWNWCFNKKHQPFWLEYLMDEAYQRQLHLQILDLKAEMRSLQEKLENLEFELMIRVQSLLENNQCLLSLEDPYSDSGNSLADWISE